MALIFLEPSTLENQIYNVQALPTVSHLRAQGSVAG
jgi:hypothetical protein